MRDYNVLLSHVPISYASGDVAHAWSDMYLLRYRVMPLIRWRAGGRCAGKGRGANLSRYQAPAPR